MFKSSKSFLRNTKKNSARCQRVRCIACLLCTFCDKDLNRFDRKSFNRVTKMSDSNFGANMGLKLRKEA